MTTFTTQTAADLTPGGNIQNTDLLILYRPSALQSYSYYGSQITQYMLNPMTTLGDTLYGAASGTPMRLSGNVTTANQYLRSTGFSGAATAPTWNTIPYTDITGLGTVVTLNSGTASGNVPVLGSSGLPAVGSGITTVTDPTTSSTHSLNTTLANIYASSSGTVSTVSVVSANGFTGSVATPTTTPAITLTTSITGLLKGNGTAISAATSGTDYSLGTSALTTGILKSTTTTGALTIAVAGDFPTLNQSTTGNALTATTSTTATNIAGGAANSLPNQSGSGATQMLATTNSSVLCTNGSGVLGWQTQLPNANVSAAIFLQQGRLTDTTGTPNGSNSSSGSATIYFTPGYGGNSITLYNGSSWITQTFAEVSTSAAITAGNYDVYITSASSTTVTLSTVIWTNDTTPPTRDTQNGRLVQHSTPTALFVGSFRTDGAKTYSWNGTRWIINSYNQRPLNLYATAGGTSWSVTSTTPVAENGNTTDGVGRVSFLILSPLTSGISFNATFMGNNSSQFLFTGVALDSTTTAPFQMINFALTQPASLAVNGIFNSLNGYHYLQKTENVNSSTGTSFGTNGSSITNTLQAIIQG